MWNYGNETMQRLNRTNNLRYRLLPYTYSGFHRVEIEGYTMQRALVLDFGTNFSNIGDEFMWGPALLVAPIVSQQDDRASGRSVALPELAAGRWRNFWTGDLQDSGDIPA